MSREELQHQLDTAYATIRELDDDHAAGRLSAEDHASLRASAERQAAALLGRLRRLEDEATVPAPRAPVAAAASAGARSRLLLGVVGVFLLSVGGVTGVVLGRSMSEDRAAPAGPVAAAAVAAPAAAAPAALDALRKEVEAEDAPTKKLLAFAHLSLDANQLAPAITAYKRVLARDPKNVEAIAHIGLILYRGNHIDGALKRLDEAIALDATYAHAHWDRAQVLLHGRGDHAAAARALETFLKLVPTGEDADRARDMLAEARRGVARTPAAPPGTPGPAHPPASGRRG